MDAPSTISIDQLKCDMAACTACDLHQHRKQIVFGTGNFKSPKIMFVGEGPGEEEDEKGMPFVGKCGSKLNEMIAFLNLKREDVYISNSVLCRCPNNRPPVKEEMDSCKNRLYKEIEIVNPGLIVTLGRSATVAVSGREFKTPLNHFMKDGKFFIVEINGRQYKMAVVAHPSYHLRRKKLAWIMTQKMWMAIKEFIRGSS